jgi:hypothetical protein
LNASEINENLMNQAIAVFSNASARSAAITSPVEGQVTYLEDTAAYESYNGTSWVALITPSTSGLTLLATQTFTAATSVVVDNVFSSTYNSYKIILSSTSSSPSSVLINWRVAGVNATTNYNQTGLGNDTGAIFRTVTTNAASARIGRWDYSGGLVDVTIHGVALPQRTFGVSNSIDTSQTTELNGHFHTTATAYDGFRVVVPSSTGEVRVYGLEN